MKDRPQFDGWFKHQDFREEIPGYFPIVEILSDGRNFCVNISEMCIEHFTQDVIDKIVFVLTDGIYRTRPDLRKQ